MPGVGSHHLVRTVAALVALAAVAAGCGNNDDSTGDEPRTPRPSTPEATTETPTEPAALDPCALVDAAAVSDALGTQLRVTSRGARPAANGWQTTCGYGTFPGSYVVSVEVSTEVDPETFPTGPRNEDEGEGDAGKGPGNVEGRDGESGELQPLEDLGDAAWSEVLEPPSEYVSGNVNVHILRGDHGLRVTSSYRNDDEPKLDGTIEVARAALENLPESFSIPPFDLEPPCSDIDTDLAATATDSEVVSGRSLVDGENVVCEFSLTDGGISIWSGTSDEMITAFEQGLEYGVPVEGLGDAAFSLGDGIASLQVRRGDRIVAISAFSGSPPEEQLNDAEREFAESVLAAFD